MDKLVDLQTWARAHFISGAPSLITLRRWAREGRFNPPAQRVGKKFYLREDARYFAPAGEKMGNGE